MSFALIWTDTRKKWIVGKIKNKIVLLERKISFSNINKFYNWRTLLEIFSLYFQRMSCYFLYFVHTKNVDAAFYRNPNFSLMYFTVPDSKGSTLKDWREIKETRE